MAVRPLWLAGLVSAGLCLSSSASAYCRTHTKDPPASSCPEQCQEEGLPLFWAKSQLTYAINEDGFPGLSNDELRRILGNSFQTWENVRCGSQPVGLDIRALTEPTSLQEGPREEEPNENVIAHLTASEWRERRYDPDAYAITAVWFNARNGEIMGADILFNGRMDEYGVCSPSGCTGDDPRTDLANVATHEIGHFLGLSHSDEPDSTMWCGAAPSEVSKRSLDQDDVDGLCDIYPPGDAFRRDQAVTNTGMRAGCALTRGPEGGANALWLLAPALWLMRRRRQIGARR